MRFSQLPIFTILNLIDVEVLIKIRKATSDCLCDVSNIKDMKTLPTFKTVWYITALDFMGKEMITFERTPR